MFRRIIIFSLLILLCGAAMAAPVSLLWDASTSPNVTNYRVYWGTSPRSYTTVLTINNVTAYSVNALPPGTYYFAVTAIDADGNESDFSNEVSKTIGAAPSAPGNFRIPPVVITNTYPPPKVVGNNQ